MHDLGNLYRVLELMLSLLAASFTETNSVMGKNVQKPHAGSRGGGINRVRILRFKNLISEALLISSRFRTFPSFLTQYKN